MASSQESVQSVLSQSSDTDTDSTDSSQSSAFDENLFVEIEYEIIAGHRKNSQLVWSPTERQLYKLNANSKIGASYVCYDSLCNVRVYMKDDKCFKSKTVHSHEHSHNADLYEEFVVINEVKKKAIECKKMDLREIYNDVMSR